MGNIRQADPNDPRLAARLAKRDDSLSDVKIASKEEVSERIAVCSTCVFFTRSKCCDIVGCKVPVIILARKWECPLEKWPDNSLS